MAYQHALVAVAMTPESHILVEKAVSIIRPVGGEISLITIATEPELYNCLAAPMLENVRLLMQEKITLFFDDIKKRANYPINQTHIVYGELTQHVCRRCKEHGIDLVICGNHNQHFFRKLICSARKVIDKSEADVLIVPL